MEESVAPIVGGFIRFNRLFRRIIYFPMTHMFDS
jgi:hypothetical protein